MQAAKPGMRRAPSGAMRLARKSWRIQYSDSAESLRLAEEALARATAADDVAAEAWARLTRGFHRMRYGTPHAAVEELTRAQRCFEASTDRIGQILSIVGTARCWWIEGKYRDSLEVVLPLRDEGLHLLEAVERGILLNTIAGCYSALGQSADAFAYLYQALDESRSTRSHGIDVVLFCNLAHELYHLGDYDNALSHIEEGLECSANLNNARLVSVLLVNRIVCLTDLNRPKDALQDVRRLMDMPADESGRGSQDPAFETMAIAALRAGEVALGLDLVERALASFPEDALPNKRVELTVAVAEGLRARGRLSDAAEHLEKALSLLNDGLSLRSQCLLFQTLSNIHEASGNAILALTYLRAWQEVHILRAQRASQARFQAALLQTELLRLQHQRDEIEARRRSTERAKAELEAINLQLSQKIAEVQALQDELKQEAVRDFLTGLFNRRHLNNVLPSMLALAQRHDEPLAFVIIDLDDFKTVNDKHGHVAGDVVLIEFGRLLANGIRKSDVACRYGGDEFCLLMPRTAAQSAARKIEMLQKAWRGKGNSFSAGVSDSQQSPGSLEKLLQAADDAVLEAKRLGRNRVVVK